MVDYIITASGVHAMPGTYRPVDLGPAIRRRDIRMRAAMAERQRYANAAKEEPERSTQVSFTSSQVEKDDDDVYDDLGELPPEFWEGVERLEDEPLAMGVVDH
jgi:hypothetical protein